MSFESGDLPPEPFDDNGAGQIDWDAYEAEISEVDISAPADLEGLNDSMPPSPEGMDALFSRQSPEPLTEDEAAALDYEAAAWFTGPRQYKLEEHFMDNVGILDVRLSGPEEVVKRHLEEFDTVMSSLNEGVDAIGKLAESGSSFAGRTVLGTSVARQLTSSFTKEYSVEISSDRQRVEVGREYHHSNEFHEMRIGEDEVRFISPDGQRRATITVENRTLTIKDEVLATLQPGDLSHLVAYREQLAAYKELLEQVAQQAGFRPEQLADAYGNHNEGMAQAIAFAVGDAAFQRGLPPELRSSLLAHAEQLSPHNPDKQDQYMALYRVSKFFKAASNAEVAVKKQEDGE